MRQAPSIADESGFTLIEALVALAITGLVIASLSTVATQWLPNWSHGVSGLQSSERTATALDRLVADISAAKFVRLTASKQLAFRGTNRSMAFVRSSIEPNSGPSLEYVKLEQTSDSHGAELVRTRASLKPTGASGQALVFTDPVVLLTGAFKLEFAYASNDHVWHDHWAEQYLPTAVKISVYNANGHLVTMTATPIHRRIPANCITAKSEQDCARLLSSATGPNAPDVSSQRVSP